MYKDTMRRELKELKEMIANVVCSEGEDRGVILVSHESVMERRVVKTPGGFEVERDVYKHKHFSPLGDAMIEIYDKVTELEREAWE